MSVCVLALHELNICAQDAECLIDDVSAIGFHDNLRRSFFGLFLLFLFHEFQTLFHLCRYHSEHSGL